MDLLEPDLGALTVPLLYALLTYLAFAALLPVLLAHPKLRRGFRQRLGLYRGDPLHSVAEESASPATGGGRRPGASMSPRVWLHGASAGDLLSLLPIADELARLRPDARFIVSTITNTGALMAARRFPTATRVYAPYDLPGATRRAVAALRPDLLVLEYTEIWPALIRAARGAGARVALTNGRFGEGNLARYRWLFRLTGQPLRSLDALLMREEVEAERARSLGAPPARVHVTGNTKFDALVLSVPERDDVELARALGLVARPPALVAGSTHEGEEAILLDVFAKLRADFPSLRLVLAPRYIDRAPRIVALAEARGFRVALRSASDGRSEPGGRRSTASPATGGGEVPDVSVLDTIGELTAAYRLASLVFVGGSFTARGGQNILEPAACGKPVLFGPRMENFHDSVQVLVGRGGIQVRDAAALAKVAAELLARPEKLAELGELARAAVAQVRGASARNAALLARLLPPPRQST